MSSAIITRFAPSPTGFLHIGGARTALFNWVYSQKLQGRMLLRIEDTDDARSTKEAVSAIIEGLKWLDINWDGEAVSQKSHKARHQQIAYELVKNGKAYYCSCTKEELEAKRQQALAKGTSLKYDGSCRYKNLTNTNEATIRIKAPETGSTIINDLVQGKVEFNNKDLDDFIILRSDGTPTFMHAVVVDDHDMGITHIIRGDDHLTNAAKQIIIYQAMNWAVPQMAHIPLIHGEDGAKLSKRHGALGVHHYKTMGYLPQAIRNYLMRLGWSHGNDEIMSMEQIIKWFDIKDVNKGAARFDFKKLDHLNAYYIKTTNASELYEYIINNLDLPNINFKSPQYKEQLIFAISIVKERVKTLVELINLLSFILEAPKVSLNNPLIPTLIKALKLCPTWDKTTLQELMKNFTKINNIKMSDIANLTRLILTGTSNNLNLSDIFLILGHKETLQRLNNMI